MKHSDNAPERFIIEDTDRFIVSYPRSGQTWLRSLIAHVRFANKNWMLSHVDTVIPDFRRTTKEQRRHMPRPRLFKSHEFYNYRYKNVLYLIRDPRAVAYSQWNWRRRMRVGHQWRYEGPFDIKFIEAFVDGRIFPGSWDKHVYKWNNWVSGKFTVVKYEDIYEDTENLLIKICKWLKISYDIQKIDEAIKAFPAGQPTHFLKNSIKPLFSNPSAWSSHMTDEMNKMLSNTYYDTMQEFGYDA